MIRVLFVCLGNICRSPLAQGIFEKKIEELNLESRFYVDSAGTSAQHKGEKPHIGSIKIAKEYGIDIKKQRSRPVSLSDQNNFDWFIAMDSSNVHNLVTKFNISEYKILKLRQFDSKEKNGNVPDPWGFGEERFDEVFQIIDRSMRPLIDYLIKDL